MRTHARILSACTRVRSYLYQRAILHSSGKGQSKENGPVVYTNVSISEVPARASMYIYIYIHIYEYIAVHIRNINDMCNQIEMKHDSHRNK